MAKLKYLLPISGLLVAILGITLVFITEDVFYKLSIPIGIAMVLLGFTEFVSHYKKEKQERTKNALVSGGVAVLLGLYTVFGRGIEAVTTILPIVFALWIVSVSACRIKDALERRSQGRPLWFIAFSFGVLSIGLGILLVFHQRFSIFVVIYSLAAMFISYGINTIYMFFQIKRNGVDEEC